MNLAIYLKEKRNKASCYCYAHVISYIAARLSNEDINSPLI